MAFFNFPFHIEKDKPAVASEVQTNFDALRSWILDNVLQKDGTNASTGPIVLPPGPPSSPDQAANKAYVDAVMPIGVMMEYAGTVLPSKWLWCDGTVYTNTSKPALSAAIGRTYTEAGVPDTSFQVPNMKQRVPVGKDAADAVFALGKFNPLTARNSELLSHFHVIPEHGHGSSASADQRDLQHQHPINITTSDAGQHGHGWGHGTEFWWRQPNAWGLDDIHAGGAQLFGAVQWLHDGNHNHGVNGHTGVNWLDGGRYHTHTITVSVANQAAFNTQFNGAGTTLIDKNLPPYLVVNYIIYAGA